MKGQVSRRGFMASAAVGVGAASLGATQGASRWQPYELKEPKSIQELDTPALLIDLDAFEANLRKMAAHVKAKGVGLRPHAKTHKCPIVAKKQIELGAIGICAAKVSEAEEMIRSGIENVLITSPVVTTEKIDRVIAIAKQSSGVQMVIDNPRTAQDFNAAAEAAGITLRVLIDLDTGTRRTGIEPGKPALKLLEEVKKNKSLQFDGLQAYAGHVMHIKGHEKRKERSLESLAKCIDTKAMMEKAGHEVGVFSGGGTGTFDIDCDVEGLTDLQLGSYPFMDVQYRAIGDVDSEVFDTFAPSLFVLSTAISKPVKELITIDAGYKAFANEPRAVPQFRNVEGVMYHYGGDEHGMIQFLGDERPIKLGDKLELIVSHCDPTVNLYDYYHPYRDGKVEEVWPIAARGKSQ